MNGCCRGTRDFASSCRGTARFHVAVYRDSATYRDRKMCRGTARRTETARCAKGPRDVQGPRDMQRDRAMCRDRAICKGTARCTEGPHRNITGGRDHQGFAAGDREGTHSRRRPIRSRLHSRRTVSCWTGLDWCAASNLSACRRRMHRISMNDHAH